MALSIEKCRQILLVSEDASLKEVKEAYVDLAKVWHPDRFTGDPRLEKKATERLAEINEAYAVLEAFLEAEIREVAGESPPPDNEGTEAEAPREEEEKGQEPGWRPQMSILTIVMVGVILAGLGVSFSLVFKYTTFFTPAPVITRPPPGPEVPGEPVPEGKQSSPPAGKKGPAPAEKGVRDKKTPDRGAFFTLGSSKEEVLAAEGPPIQTAEDRWKYGSSYVDFTRGRVSGWNNSLLRPLRVRMKPGKAVMEGYFTVGSSRDAVVAVQGTPTRVAGSRWNYGFSRVDFTKGRVSGWYSSNMEPLKVKMTAEPLETEQQYFAVGSSKNEVLAIQGTPTQLTEKRWGYGYSYVDFEKGKVARWYNSEQDPLSVEPEE